MACKFSLELTNIQLLQYVDGEADTDVIAHIEKCAHCSARADQLRLSSERLSGSLYRATCPPSMELGEYHLDTLSASRSAVIKQHLADCPHCQEELAQLEEFLMDDLELSPFRAAKVLVAQLHTILEKGQEETGTLMPALAGIRSEGNVSEGAPLVYRVDDIQISLEVHTESHQTDKKVLLGIVTGLATEGLKVHLQQQKHSLEITEVDPGGNFILPGLIGGSYELLLRHPETDVLIRDLAI